MVSGVEICGVSEWRGDARGPRRRPPRSHDFGVQYKVVGGQAVSCVWNYRKFRSSSLSTNTQTTLCACYFYSPTLVSRPLLPKLEAAVWVALLPRLSHGRRPP